MHVKKKTVVQYLVLSDIHLGHANNSTENIVNNLMVYFKDNHKLFKMLDIIFIAGDIFDKLLMSNSKQYRLIMQWLTALIKYCEHNNIKLRILEGTKSHDWQQASVIDSILERLKLDLDFKYIDDVVIEDMNDLGLSILYIPDEHNHIAEDTYNEVKALMATKGITQVDIAIMHGQFHYQLPMVKLESSHNESDYTDIVKYFISIGHIHKHSVNGKILAQGSFDRLAQGEEEPKGAMVMSINTTTENGEYVFLENKNAMLFRTLDYRGKVDHDVIKELDSLKSIYKHGSFLRVLVNEDSSLAKNKHEIRIKYPMFHIDIETPTISNTKDERIDLKEVEDIDSFSITPKNIKELVMIEFDKHDKTIEHRKLAVNELDNILKEI